MRNLKKFLALVLAVMMVMSLLITADAAVNIKTSSDVTADYELAVDVLYKLGVLQGENNGVYNPNGYIQRKNFATLLFRINTGYTNYRLADSWAPDAAYFNDVTGNEWYAGTVGYAYTEGLIKGENGNFNPDDYVTGLQVVTALARILGYDQNKELQGSSYKPTARNYARSRGFTDNLTTADTALVIADKPITNEAVAQMVYNTLMLNYVDYTSMGYVSTQRMDDSTRTPGRSLYKLARYAKDDKDLPAGITAADFDRDEFGRPEATHILVVKDEIIYKERPTPIGTYNGNFDGATAKKLTKDPNEVNIYYNGAPLSNVDKKWGADADPNNSGNGWKWGDDTHGIPGYEVEVYKHIPANSSDKVKYDIVLREAFLAVVGATNKSNGEITVAIYGAGPAPNSYTNMKVGRLADVYDQLATFKEGDYIAVYPTTNWNNSGEQAANRVELLEIAKLETKTGSVTEVYNSKANGKWESWVEMKVNNQYPTFKIAAEALILDKTQLPTTPFGSAVTQNGVLDKIDLGATTLYLHNGHILLIDQRPSAQDPTYVDAGYAYFYDVIQDATPDTTTPGDHLWDSEGGNTPGGGASSTTFFRGRLLLPNKSTLGGIATGVTIKMTSASTFEAFEKELGKLVLYVKNDGGWYDIYPIAGKNLDGLTTVNASGGSTYVQITGTSADFTAATQVQRLTITKNKSEGVMPSDTDMSTLGTGSNQTANVAFDLDTAIYVVKTGHNGKAPDFDYEYNVYTIETLPADIDITRGLVTVVGDFNRATPATPAPTMLDGQLDGSDHLKVARAVLIVDSGVRDTSLDPYFIVYRQGAPLIGLYKDKPGESDPFWFYEFDAVVNGKYQKVLVKKDLVKSGGAMFDTDTIAGDIGTSNYWLGTKVTLKDYVNEKGETKQVIESITGATPLAVDTLISVTSVTKYEHGRIGVNGYVDGTAGFQLTTGWTASETSGESYIVRTGGKAFTYDLYAGTITEISIEDFTATSVGSGGTYENATGIAVRSSSHYDLNALFIDKSVAP